MEFICPPRYVALCDGGDPRRIQSPAGPIACVRRDTMARRSALLDIAYLVIGAIFLGACVLYALACEQL